MLRNGVEFGVTNTVSACGFGQIQGPVGFPAKIRELRMFLHSSCDTNARRHSHLGPKCGIAKLSDGLANPLGME